MIVDLNAEEPSLFVYDWYLSLNIGGSCTLHSQTGKHCM